MSTQVPAPLFWTEVGDCGDHRVLLHFGEFWIDGQGEHLPTGGFGCGKVALLVAEIGEGFLEVQRNRIVNLRGMPRVSRCSRRLSRSLERTVN